VPAEVGGLSIGQRVRAVHLSQYCPGGLGFPAGSPGAGPAGRAGSAGLDGHAAQAAGETCVRCGRRIGGGEPVRRQASGGWVHESCRG
jgi:hypothetical protein